MQGLFSPQIVHRDTPNKGSDTLGLLFYAFLQDIFFSFE
tara:strand:- start:516 stop:632 length:117 start_codon:yes stop_codon:yes gene_type:complete